MAEDFSVVTRDGGNAAGESSHGPSAETLTWQNQKQKMLTGQEESLAKAVEANTESDKAKYVRCACLVLASPNTVDPISRTA